MDVRGGGGGGGAGAWMRSDAQGIQERWTSTRHYYYMNNHRQWGLKKKNNATAARTCFNRDTTLVSEAAGHLLSALSLRRSDRTG